MNKLQKAIYKPKELKFLNHLKKILDIKDKIDILSKTISDIDNTNRLVKLITYLQKWYDNSNKLGEKLYEDISKIQRAFKTYKANKEKKSIA